MITNLVDVFFKMVWIALAGFTVYYWGAILLLEMMIQSLNTEKELTILNFLLPNTLGLLLVLWFTKEVTRGYHPKSVVANRFSLTAVVILIILVFYFNVNYYQEYISSLDGRLGLDLIPILVLFSSFLGLILNRFLSL